MNTLVKVLILWAALDVFLVLLHDRYCHKENEI